MSFTVFLGNLPTWVTADDIKGWLAAENLVADAIKVIRNPETQESKGFAFIDAPNTEEMNAIIRRFDRAPLEDRLLRANPAQPPKSKGQARPAPGHGPGPGASPAAGSRGAANHGEARPPRRSRKSGAKRADQGGAQSAFAEELAKVL
ncbi:MAG TPA: RNA-binding protein [Bryobacteraceae bacterium]|nr:RNA-binding protein [Bryobacteraceae bacterium]